MRTRFGIALVALFTSAGCSTSSTPEAWQASPDAGSAATDAGTVAELLGFEIVTPTVTVQPNSEITYCYYFQTSNTAEVAVRRWTSQMTDGGQQMILFLTPGNLQSPGTMATTQCGLSSSGSGPVWTYSAGAPPAELRLPANDGNGRHVAQVIKASQSGFLEMHFVNTTGQVRQAHVELRAYAYDDGVAITPAAPFVTFNTSIDLPAAPSPASPTSDTVTGECSVPPDAKFYFVSTHTHRQGVRAFVKDGAAMVFDTTNWSEPGEVTWSVPFFSFKTGNLSYQCDYNNPNGYRIKYGDSAATDEVCMAIGYYFPASDATGHLCLNSSPIY
jgi:hypothetical protein